MVFNIDEIIPFVYSGLPVVVLLFDSSKSALLPQPKINEKIHPVILRNR
jgi:hypothetical protein